jgi:hypothetical protein
MGSLAMLSSISGVSRLPACARWTKSAAGGQDYCQAKLLQIWWMRVSEPIK